MTKKIKHQEGKKSCFFPTFYQKQRKINYSTSHLENEEKELDFRHTMITVKIRLSEIELKLQHH